MFCFFFFFSTRLDRCADGATGHYGTDNSIDSIVVASDPPGKVLAQGQKASITVKCEHLLIFDKNWLLRIILTIFKVYTHDGGVDSYLDFFQTILNGAIISWEHIATTRTHHGGDDSIVQSFNLASGYTTQAVRVQLRKGGNSPIPCSDSELNSWNDRVRCPIELCATSLLKQSIVYIHFFI